MIVVGVDHVMHVVIIVSLIVDVRYVLPVEAEAAEMLVTVFVILALACPDLNVDAGAVVPSVASPLIAVMVQTFVGLITDVSVVSLMPVASVRLTVHETEPGVGAVLAEELMMIRSAAAEAVTMTSLSLLTRLKMKMRKTKIKTLPRMKLLLPPSHLLLQLMPKQLRKTQRTPEKLRRRRPRKPERQRRKLLVLLAQSLQRTLLLLQQLRLHLLRLPKCLDVCIGGISTYTRSFRLLAIHVFVIALGIHMLYPYEEGVKSF